MPTTAGLRPATPHGCPIGALGAALGTEAHTVAGSPADPALVVLGVTLDSRAVGPGDVYAALPGAHVHGAQFAAQAQRDGAVAVLTDEAGLERLRDDGCTLPAFVVPSPRAVLGDVAARVYGTVEGGSRLALLGVTGTNGKTTTTYLLDSALRAAGRTTALIGTVETRVAGQRVPSVRTTPEAPEMHRLLAVMRERGVQVCSMEVSSQALAQHRVDGIVVDVAGFTSFSQDHLELHGDMATYLAAKAMLFTPEHSRRAVVVVDDDGGRQIAQRATVPVETISGTPDADADWVVVSRVHDRTGTDFVLRPRHAAGLSTGELELRCPLPGDFNVMNTALAAVMLLRYGLSPRAVVRGLRHAGGVPGRMEQVGAAGGEAPLVVVDYAHTPDAITAALGAVRPVVSGRLLVVLGAGGDRDPSKRAAMGAAAARAADVVVVTDDNPRSEDPAAIRAVVLAGAREAARTSSAEVVEIADRGDAIRYAVDLAGAGDVLLVAGKGHEQGQEVGGEVHPFDDRDQVRTALARRTAAHS
ncbi:MAG TPA: UDP-N-acetylmuramoyl-L-alanyl-D-glutamate--2,6-diaminopimelate ligase [Actinomycetales bacterium]|nr:UDP-N-acetylmuramoyl-L-alanyl-D-glutamate--2,6-diaminopimelate ligase [Actinomycetales bacterium]